MLFERMGFVHEHMRYAQEIIADYKIPGKKMI